MARLCPCCATSLACAAFLAGKVHGSLARAGKVRGQTPKVPKQEKKKQPKVSTRRRQSGGVAALRCEWLLAFQTSWLHRP
jgi:ribosomal protein S30